MFFTFSRQVKFESSKILLKFQGEGEMEEIPIVEALMHEKYVTTTSHMKCVKKGKENKK